MSKQYSSREILNALRKAGFQEVSQRGSHLKMRATRGGRRYTVIVKHPAASVPNQDIQIDLAAGRLEPNRVRGASEIIEQP